MVVVVKISNSIYRSNGIDLVADYLAISYCRYLPLVHTQQLRITLWYGRSSAGLRSSGVCPGYYNNN